jgi:hypothetical protein
VVTCWRGLVERINRRTLDQFTATSGDDSTPRNLESLNWAILRHRRVLAMQLRP